MKSVLIIIMLISFMLINTASTQESDPACACAQPELVVTLGGKLKIDYTEIAVCTLDDGSVLLVDQITDDYYIVKGGVTQGPVKQDDPRIAGFSSCYSESKNTDDMLVRYKGILSKSGGKYLITMGGKNYGPFIEIIEFTVTRSRDKFAVFATSKDGEMPRLVTNIPNVTFDLVNSINAGLCGNLKYDELLVVTENSILNLQGKKLFDIKPDMSGCERLFVNTTNTRYAWYDFGTLTFSDGKSLPGCFNPHLLSPGGTVYLAYMYYSPKKNAIMQCKIPF